MEGVPGSRDIDCVKISWWVKLKEKEDSVTRYGVTEITAAAETAISMKY